MGYTYSVKCKNCDYEQELFLGGGALPPDHFKTEIIKGEFGDGPKEALNLHPEMRLTLGHDFYHCRCGYLTERTVIGFRDKYRSISFDKFQCPNCGKPMKRYSEEGFMRFLDRWYESSEMAKGRGETIDEDYPIKCPKCSCEVELFRTGLWD